MHTVPPLTRSSFEDMLCAKAGPPIGGLESELTSHVVLTACQGYDIECARDVLLACSVLRPFGSGKIEKDDVC